jgi:hypothetical protein
MKRKLWELRIKLRKWTTPFHVLFGLLLAALFPYYPLASIILFAGFAFDEWWDYKSGQDIESQKDFWEGLCAFSIGMGVVLILRALRVYPV